MLVKSDVLPLRVFVALALPTLVWGVFALVRDSVSDEQLVDAVFGALVGLCSVAAPGTPLGGPPGHPLTTRRRAARPGITGRSVRLDRVWARCCAGEGVTSWSSPRPTPYAGWP